MAAPPARSAAPAAPVPSKQSSSLGTSSPWKGFLFSGIACCAAEAVTFPIDTVKTRLQLQGELGAKRQYKNSFDALKIMAASEGISSWYKGLAPALLRQATYGTIRYGAYEPIKKLLSSEADGEVFPLWKKVVAGTLSGAISSSICNPTDLIKVRMQADTGASGAPRYRSIFHAAQTIFRAEGVVGFYRGVGPTCGRASIGAATELATYDEIKQQLMRLGVVGADIKGHVAASLCAGFISTVAISPFDVVKSRVMNQPVDSNNVGKLYSGMIDCFRKSVQAEGILSLWKGFWPNYARVGPRVVIIFVVLEQLRSRFP